MLKEVDIKKGIKYLFSSGSSFLIDLVLFTIFEFLFNNIVLATILARILSSLYNYYCNSRLVFKSYTKTSIIKYYSLVIIQMLVSSFLVDYLSSVLIKINVTVIKFFVDVCIFIVNYFIQKGVIFK